MRQDSTRRDKARLFVELNVPALAELRREIHERSVATKETWLWVRLDSARRSRRATAPLSHRRQQPGRVSADYYLI